MAATASRETEQLRRELQSERAQLARAVDSLRGSADLIEPLRARLPLVLAAAFGAGFLLAGGIGATMRLLFRRSRERRVTARLGPFALIARN
jgi:hypothetical protein